MIEAEDLCPPVPLELLQWLEKHNPPRCMGEKETLEAHLRYAGRVQLIADLRAHYALQNDPDNDN